MNDNLNLIVERGRVWDINDLKPYSIALDGAVRGPYFDNKNMIFSFDHHENCIRHISSATCVQVMEALMLGFEPKGYTIFINDIDSDTVLSFFLLENPKYIEDKFFVNLVNIIGKIDALGPAYQLFEQEEDLLFTFNKVVMSKYNELKETGDYNNYDLSNLLYESCSNLREWLKSPSILKKEIREFNYNIEPVTNNKEWIMVNGDYYLFGELYKKGFNRIIAWKLLPNNTYSYTIAKKSEFVIWDINNIIKGLNLIESGWGGGSTIAGAPRNADGTRSKIKPEDLVDIINKLMKN
ncbi:MAG: hypothetical protein U0354_15460 [Candidatus Sericytochromatia bacterium]